MVDRVVREQRGEEEERLEDVRVLWIEVKREKNQLVG